MKKNTGTTAVSITLALSCALGICSGNQADSPEDSRTEAISLLQRSFRSQSILDRVSIRGVTDVSIDNDKIHHRVEYWLRRDGERLDYSISLFQTDPKRSKLSYHARSINTEGKCVSYMWNMHEKNGPKGAGFSSKRYIEDLVHPDTGGPMDGYFAIRPIERITKVLQSVKDLRVAGQEIVVNIPCKVVVGSNRYGRFRLWLAESKGCLPLQIIYKKGPEDLDAGINNSIVTDKPISEVKYPDGKGGFYWFTEITYVLDNVQVEQRGTDYILTAGRFARILKVNGGNELKSEFNYKRTEIDLHPHFGQDAFHADLAEGNQLANDDNLQSGVKYEWRDGRIVPAHSHYSGSAEGKWPRRSVWLLLFWTFTGLALLMIAFRVLRRKKPDGGNV